MFKMIRLDWSAIKYYRNKIFILPVCLFLIGCMLSGIYLVPLSVFLFFSFSLNTFAVEEKVELNCLYLTLPIKRHAVVMGRYLLSLLLFLCAVVLGFALLPLVNLISLSKWYPDIIWSLTLFSIGFLQYALMSLFMYPLLFRLGYQKGKLWGMYVPLGIFGFALLLLELYINMPGHEDFLFRLLVYASEHILGVCCGILGAAAAILAVSYLLSVRIYTRREF